MRTRKEPPAKGFRRVQSVVREGFRRTRSAGKEAGGEKRLSSADLEGGRFNVLPNTGLRARYRRCVIARLPAVHADDTIPPCYIGGPPSQTIA